MKNKIKQISKKILGDDSYYTLVRIARYLVHRRGIRSFSQEGEDLVLLRLLNQLNTCKASRYGFYVDIGAHHPYRFSNTFLFYKRGWQGLNVDAMPGSMKAFDRLRSRDINLECAVGNNAEILKFYIFNEPALNTFDENLAMIRCNDICQIKDVISIPTVSLFSILKKHVGQDKKIDFLTIDVEGFDLEVLKSNDWNIYRPSVVLVEILQVSLDDLRDNPICDYMHSVGYSIYSKTVNTTFFVDNVFL